MSICENISQERGIGAFEGVTTEKGAVVVMRSIATDEQHDRTPAFHAIEAAAMRALGGLTEKRWPPAPRVYRTVKSSRRLHLSTFLASTTCTEAPH